jgi:hypothetical protein
MMAIKAAKGWRARARTIVLGAVLVVLAFLIGRWLRGKPQSMAVPNAPDPQEPSPTAEAMFAPEPRALVDEGGAGPSGNTVARLHVARFHPRDPEEWQGMPVDLNMSPECDTSSRCGLALACISGHCGPCASDADCAIGEECVLDHCLLRKNVSCRHRRDCDGGDTCMLTGLSPGARGNSDMRVVCRGGSNFMADMPRPDGAPPAPHWGPQVHPEISAEDLLRRLRNDAGVGSTASGPP